MLKISRYFSILLLVSCAPGQSINKTLSEVSAQDYFQVMSATELQRTRALVPHVAYPKLATILRSPATLWYTSKEIVPAWQDNTPNFYGMRRNDFGSREPIANPMFKGKSWKFPFGHTAGTDASTNFRVVNFLSLPLDQNQKRVPVAFWKERYRHNWMFPRGTTIGELMLVRDSNGSETAFEIRTRTKFASGWAANVYRPFPESKDLMAAIKQARPQFHQSPSLVAVVNHLQSGTLQSDTLAVNFQTFRKGFETVQGHQDELPDFADETLVKELLKKTPFKSAYGKTWRTTSQGKTYAATTKANFSIVPKNFRAGLIENNDRSCARCHVDAGRPLTQFNSRFSGYGDLWGKDFVFSFHIMNMRGSGRPLRFRVRDEFVKNNIVIPYNQSQHPETVYKRLPTPWTARPDG